MAAKTTPYNIQAQVLAPGGTVTWQPTVTGWEVTDLTISNESSWYLQLQTYGGASGSYAAGPQQQGSAANVGATGATRYIAAPHQHCVISIPPTTSLTFTLTATPPTADIAAPTVNDGDCRIEISDRGLAPNPGVVTASQQIIIGNTPSVNIATIAANQSIDVANTPSVNIATIAANQSINIANTPSVSIAGTPSVQLSAGSASIGSVTVSSGSIALAAGTASIGTVSLASGSTVAISSGTVNVGSISGTVTVSGSVSISGTPSVSISGTPSVSISSGSVNIGNTPNINIQSQGAFNLAVEQNLQQIASFSCPGSGTVTTEANVAVPAWANALLLLPDQFIGDNTSTLTVTGTTTGIVYSNGIVPAFNNRQLLACPVAPASDSAVTIVVTNNNAHAAGGTMRVDATPSSLLQQQVKQPIETVSVGDVVAELGSNIDGVYNSSNPLPVNVRSTTAVALTPQNLSGTLAVNTWTKMGTVLAAKVRGWIVSTDTAGQVAVATGTSSVEGTDFYNTQLAAGGAIAVMLPDGYYIDASSPNNAIWAVQGNGGVVRLTLFETA